MTLDEKEVGSMLDKETSAMTLIVRDHKVYWTTLPIELASGEGRPLKVGMALALVGTDADDGASGEGRAEYRPYTTSSTSFPSGLPPGTIRTSGLDKKA